MPSGRKGLKWTNIAVMENYNFAYKIKTAHFRMVFGNFANSASWFHKIPRQRGEQIDFDPSENLQNSMYAGDKTESRSSCGSIYTVGFAMKPAICSTCRCELIPFLRILVFLIGSLWCVNSFAYQFYFYRVRH